MSNENVGACPKLLETVIGHLLGEVETAIQGLSPEASDLIVLGLSNRLVDNLAYDTGTRWSGKARGEMIEIASRIYGLAVEVLQDLDIGPAQSDRPGGH
ncbi:hypothetical protein RGUI_0744 [Rhodovulum sp. P5]|uniref:hypothetical protein n=1 Tax=Rhodovulum sp. P5 TaxID=1564506 RepID=UPI0009C29782|nr:hypothetical protein [Rhodovulum sp. P5]ARE38885.1 hypothetical protein RGUI_0744 [Rhodovulum sp. P5]